MRGFNRCIERIRGWALYCGLGVIFGHDSDTATEGATVQAPVLATSPALAEKENKGRVLAGRFGCAFGSGC